MHYELTLLLSAKREANKIILEDDLLKGEIIFDDVRKMNFFASLISYILNL